MNTNNAHAVCDFETGNAIQPWRSSGSQRVVAMKEASRKRFLSGTDAQVNAFNEALAADPRTAHATPQARKARAKAGKPRP